MKWIEAIFGAIKEYLKRVNKVPQKEIAERESERTETKGLKSNIKQIKLSKKKMKTLNRWFRWAVKNGYAQKDEDKVEAYLKWREKDKSF